MSPAQPRRRVELVHESLLKEWPRLVRWRAEEIGGAQLRDELRQAAQMWDQHERSDDYLWTGMAFQEYRLWRTRYGGGLTTLENEFIRTMESLATRRRRRRRLLSLTLFFIVLIIAIGFGVLWRTSVTERTRAEVAADRATGSKLLALGQAVIDKDRTAALAYATESIRIADSREAREFAIRALWQGPPAMVSPGERGMPWRMEFSPDGEWLAVGYWNGDLRVYPSAGREPVHLTPQSGTSHIEFSADGSGAFTAGGTSSKIQIWSVPDWSLRRTLDLGRGRIIRMGAAASTEEFVFGDSGGWNGPMTVRRWTADGREPVPIDPSFEADAATVDFETGLIATGVGHDLKIRNLENPPEWRTLGTYPDVFNNLGAPAIDPQKRFIVAGDTGGHIRLWSLDSSGKPLREMDAAGNSPVSTVLSPDGSLLCVALAKDARIWELEGMTASDPVILPSPSELEVISGCGMHPDMTWAATPRGPRVWLWNLTTPGVRTFSGHEGGARSIVFSPDSRYLYSIGIGDGKVFRWPLEGNVGETEAVVFEGDKAWGLGLAMDPDGRYLLAFKRDGVWQIPLDGGEPRRLENVPTSFPPREIIDSNGRNIFLNRFSDGLTPDLTVLNLETGQRHEFGSTAQGDVTGWGYDTRDRLIVVRSGRLEIVDPATREIEVVVPEGAVGLRISPDRSTALTSVSGRATLLDLETLNMTSPEWNLSTSRRIQNGVMSSALGPNGAAVEVRDDGAILAGYLDESEPHLLYGNGNVADPVISPDGRWIAAATREGVSLWPMPARGKQPLHTLPHDQLLAKLESLTNVRAVPNELEPTGYRIGIDDSAYSGWQEIPSW